MTGTAILENQLSFDLSKLHDNPFGPAAEVTYPYLSSSFRDALAELYYGLEYGSRILILTAGQGLGKTTLLRHFERRMHGRGRTLILSPSRYNGREVLGKLLAEIGGTAPSDDLHTMRVKADRILSGLAEAENPFILLLDYDQDSEQSALEALRHLADLESFERRILRVVIAGSPDAAEKLQGSEFADEIRRVPLAPLTAAEVEAYIDYRLRLVGWRGGRPFTPTACTLIVERSSGKPSAINEICSNLLQNPAESESERFDSPPGNEDTATDEHHADSVPLGPQPIVLIHAYSPKRRTAALACIVLMLILAIAGLWYRSDIKVRTAKRLTAEMVVPVAPSQYSAVLHNRRLKQLPNRVHAVTGAGAAGRGVLDTTPEAISEPARNRDTAGLSHAATAAVSAVSSPTPIKAASNTAAVHLTSAVPPILLSSPAAAIPNNGGDQPAEAVMKDHKVITAPLSRIIVPEQKPASPPVRQQATATRTVAASGVAVAAGGNGATRAANVWCRSRISSPANTTAPGSGFSSQSSACSR